MNEFIFNWSIENISYSWHKDCERISSPPFVADTLLDTVWTLSLSPAAHNRRYSCMNILLKRGKDNGPRDFFFDCEFSCVSAKNLTLKTEGPFCSTIDHAEKDCYRFLSRDEVFVQRKDLYLQQDTLMLRCRMWKWEGDTNKFGQCFCRTRLELERILTVQEMDPKVSRNKKILIHSKKQNKLLLSVNIFHEEDCLEIKINRRYPSKMNFSNIEFSAEGKNGNKLHYINSWLKMPIKVSWTMSFPNHENETPFKNKLKLTCELIYSTGEETNSIEKVSPCSFKFSEFSSNCILSCIPSGKLSDCSSVCKDLKDLRSKQILCDVELKTQSTSFWVHKTVLCARSPVFLAMFTREMKEKTSECVEIEDLENDTLENFLVFLYTDSFEVSLYDTIVKLYYAADKYQVERLKFFCCSFFLKNIDVLNVCELLILADKHGDSNLKSKLKDYIEGHHQLIFGSSSWEEFSEQQPLLAAETMLSKYRKLENEKHAKERKLSNYPSALDDFRSLYQNQAVSDIVIQSKGTTFPAHKTILCAGSSRLRKIIARGKSTDSLKMEDLEEETISRLLLFLYTDSLGDIEWEDASKLYRAAVAYQIERLKIACSCFLLEHLDGTTVSQLLQLAHENKDAKLKSLVEDYISLNDIEITLSEGSSKPGKTDPPRRIETRLSKRLKLESNS